jgi:PAS domain S-box-containing protein
MSDSGSYDNTPLIRTIHPCVHMNQAGEVVARQVSALHAGARRSAPPRQGPERVWRDQDREFQRSADALPVATFICQGKRVRYANAALVSMTGYLCEELLAMNFWDTVHPEFQDLVRSRGLARQRGEGPPPCYDVKIVTKPGQERWVKLSASLIKLNGQPAVLGRALDVTHRKHPDRLQETEERYRELVERLPAITYILALNDAQSTLYISPQIESILGFSAAEWMADPDLWNRRFHPDDRERVLAEVARSHATGAPFSSEYRLLTRNGRVVWFRDEAVMVRDSKGQPLFSEGVMIEITAQRLAQPKQAPTPRPVARSSSVAREVITPREREVLRLVAEGGTSVAIAARLFISPRTVEAHRANAMRKLGLHTQAELMRYAIRLGIVLLEG